MQQLLSDFLAKRGFLSIPLVGTVTANKEPARFSVGENKINPPVTSYALSSGQEKKDELLQFIAEREHLTSPQAAEKYEAFATWLRNEFDKNNPLNLQQFSIIRNNGIFEVQTNDHHKFLYDVDANRVMRENLKHEVLVGDREASNTEMIDYFAAGEEKKSKTGLIVLLVLFLALIAGCLAYYFGMLSN